MVIISCQDVIVGKFCSCIFPSCHDLFLVQISCQYHVWLCGYINNCSWKFRKIQACGKNAAVLSILLLCRPRTQEKDDVGVSNTHTHTQSITREFPIGNFSMKSLFPKIWYFPRRREANQIDKRRDLWGWNFKKKMPVFLI